MTQDDIKHDYHLVDPSPWPAVGALGVLAMAIGAVLWINKGYAGFGVLAGIPWIFAIGLALVLYTAAGWWRDMVEESVELGAYSPTVRFGQRFGMVLFLLAETMYFVAWFWAFASVRLFPQAGWPPPGVTTLDPWGLPLLATVMILTSGPALAWAHRAIRRGDKLGAVLGLAVASVLGAGFATCMVFQCLHAPFGFGLNAGGLKPFGDAAHAALAVKQGNLGAVYGSIVYLATGFLIVHAIVGTVFLTVCLGRALAGHFSPRRQFGFEAAKWFWRFVSAVWLLMFAGIFILGR